MGEHSLNVLLMVVMAMTSVGRGDNDGRLVLLWDGHRDDVVQPDNRVFLETGSRLTLNCELRDGHDDRQPQWVKADDDGKFLPMDAKMDKKKLVATLNRLTIAVTDAGRYFCRVDKQEDIANISVQVFVSAERKQLLGPMMKNETVTIECTDDNPRWTHNGYPLEDKVKATAKTLLITSPMGRRAGVYMCTPTGKMFLLIGLPETLKHPQGSKNLMEGEQAQLKCELVGGFPLAAVSWHKINDSDTVIAVEDDGTKTRLGEHNGLKNALLTISNLHFDDAGDYRCSAEVRGRTATDTVTLKVKGKLAALWPFLGIVVEVIVMVTIIFVYERRRSPREEVVDDDDEEEDQKKALTTGETVDVRQRTGKA